MTFRPSGVGEEMERTFPGIESQRHEGNDDVEKVKMLRRERKKEVSVRRVVFAVDWTSVVLLLVE